MILTCSSTKYCLKIRGGAGGRTEEKYPNNGSCFRALSQVEVSLYLVANQRENWLAKKEPKP